MTAQSERAPAVDVLIAEDDTPTRQSLRTLLEQQGYTCAEAEDGPRAVELALSTPPRCVLLDLAMPGLDGFAVARRLRADPRTRGAHIHCLTGRTDPGAREQARQAGCEAFLTKPADLEALLAVIRPLAQPGQAEWVTGLSLTEARDLLDWLENQGCTGLEVSCPEGAGFAVRCVCPPGLRLGRDEGGQVRLFKL
jgi:CheY-like chemotaxis protein